MKTVMKYFAGVFFIVAVIALMASHSSSKTTDASNFTLQNNLSAGIGTVIINQVNSNYTSLNVNGSGSFTQTIDPAAANIVIASNQIAVGYNTTMTLPDGRKIKVTWESSAIVIVDANEF